MAYFYNKYVFPYFAMAVIASSLHANQIDFTSVNRMIIFGDSLSDAGNTGTVNSFYKPNSGLLTDVGFPDVPGWTQYPSGSDGDYQDQNRFTNNQMWWDILSQKIQSEVNPSFITSTKRALPYNPFGNVDSLLGEPYLSNVREQSELFPGDWQSTVDNTTNQNWAWGGARVATDSVITDDGILDGLKPYNTYTLSSVKTQIQAFIDDGQEVGANDVVFIWSGANDYFLYNNATSPMGKLSSYFESPLGTDMPSDLGTQAAEQQMDNIVKLITKPAGDGLGAQNVVIMTLPDLSKTPAAVNGEFDDFTLSPGDFTNQFNSALKEGVELLEYLDVNIELVDIQAALDAIIASPEENGFDPALLYGDDGEYAPQSVFINSLLGSSVALTPYNLEAIADSDDYNDGFARWLFWDHVHPTEAGHAALANYIFSTAVVPEPHVYALFAGVMALGVAVWRRRK
ncbi:MAG: SGNH/GDSL hydrolase family protein [Puniceicoccales bacterium]